jgi:ribosome biogenesis GTPase
VTPLKARLDGAVAMLVGQSGMGKSTLTNALAPESLRPTRTISESTGEGRHTTVSTALFRIPGSGELIDSPGVRDYAPPPVEDSQVQVGWPEILALAAQCRFNNCLHLREPGCAVTAAVAAKRIAPRRYESYKRLINIIRGLPPEYERRR